MNQQQKIIMDKSIRPQMKEKSLVDTIKASVQNFKAQITYLEARIAEAQNVIDAVEAVKKEVKKND